MHICNTLKQKNMHICNIIKCKNVHICNITCVLMFKNVDTKYSFYSFILIRIYQFLSLIP